MVIARSQRVPGQQWGLFAHGLPPWLRPGASTTPRLDLADRLGGLATRLAHSAMEMTMNVYAHVSLDVQRQALDVLNAELDRDHPGE